MNVSKKNLGRLVFFLLSFSSECQPNKARATKINLQSFAVRKVLDPKYIIQKFGYQGETHQVVTNDGYILTLHRIPKGIKLIKSIRPPVLLMHGIVSSSADFVNVNPKVSLGYILADMGYDVWIGNARGNSYSNKHILIDPKENPKAFYNFSWHEIGSIDIPTKIDYILNVTNQSSMYYIGHSQGSTTFYVMTSLKPEYNKKIRLASLLAPTGFLTNIPEPFIRMISQYIDQLQFHVNFLGLYHMPFLDYFRGFLQNMCSFESYEDICRYIFSLAGGFNDDFQLDKRFFRTILCTTPSDASIKQFIHYFQAIKSGKFQKFDYGSKKNIELYGSRLPPEYDINVVSSPVALYYGKNDRFVGEQDVLKMSRKLSNLANLYLVPYEKFNHGDFLFAKDVKSLVYDEMLRIMNVF